MGVILSVTVAILILFAALLWIWSPGKPAPILDATGDVVANSLSEKVFLTINGVDQGMFIRSADPTHPVLLYLHGGPGMPMRFLEQRYPTGLERDFTVVWWEQRGAGLSYDPGMAPETMTVPRLVADTVAVADAMRARFGKDKIYLMGHSWGSFIGIQAAAKAPDRFHAYIGVAQVTDQLQSERLSYDFMLDAYRAQGDLKMARQLEAAFEMTVPLPQPYMALRDAAMHRLGVGTTREMRSVISGVFLPVWMDRGYTLSEKLGVWRGKWSEASARLWNEVLATDIRKVVPKLEIPVYFLHGIDDYTVSGVLAKAYLDQLEAPLKGFYTYLHSAHSPTFEEPDRTREILAKDVLGGTVTRADSH